MINALQGVDGLMNGFTFGIDSIVQRNAERAAIHAQEYDRQLTAWQVYANGMEAKMEQLRAHYSSVLEKERQGKQEQMRYISRNTIERLSALYERIELLDERLQNVSASEHSAAAVRDLLIAEAQACEDPTQFTALNPAKRAKVAEDARRYFMDHHNVRLGSPKL